MPGNAPTYFIGRGMLSSLLRYFIACQFHSIQFVCLAQSRNLDVPATLTS
jgi:hypothetical protein